MFCFSTNEVVITRRTDEPRIPLHNFLFSQSPTIDDKHDDVPLRRSQVTGDGRCAFRSVSRGIRLAKGRSVAPLPTETLEADELRARVAQSLAVNKEEILDLCLLELKDQSADEYINDIANPRTFVGEVELILLSRLINYPIHIYLKTTNGYLRIATYGSIFNTSPIRLSFNAQQQHYDLLVPQFESQNERLSFKRVTCNIHDKLQHFAGGIRKRIRRIRHRFFISFRS